MHEIDKYNNNKSFEFEAPSSEHLFRHREETDRAVSKANGLEQMGK